ncbi:MAG: hypothetical protein CXZ00_15455 [Acidobacteria bacterium]|nr:MAG: hypothetical protein CXZ00_15455 [Acidobacteriota bacterium]
MSESDSIQDSEAFFGKVTDGPLTSEDMGFAADLPGNVPHISTHRWEYGRLIIEARAESAISGGQGVVLSGRLFNAADLAVRLRTEPVNQAALLLHAYRRWGIDFPSYLHGDFTFAFWDSEFPRLLLGRDPSGYSPLYYTQLGGQFSFASDISVLRTRQNLRMWPNEKRIANWLALQPTADNDTFFAGIYGLKPGQMLLFEHGRVVLNFFWRPENTPILGLRDPREYSDGLREVLERAVLERLPRNSAPGVHLSGGLDSSSVTALAAGLLEKEGRRIFAFTAIPEHRVTSPGRFCDEGPYASSMTEMYRNLDHVVIRHGSHSVFSMIDCASSAKCRPIIAAPNYAWIYEINMQARRRGVRTILTGAAGNLTSSYDGTLHALSTFSMEGRLVTAARVARDMHRQGVLRWRGVARHLFRPWMPSSVDHLLERWRGDRGAIHKYSTIRPEFARAHGVNMTSEDIFHRLDSRSARVLQLRMTDYGPAMTAFRHLTGVSMSDPTIDPQVVSYCFSVPVEYFCEGGVPRSLIRNAMAGRLPDLVRLERRRGLQAADFRFHFQTERQEALAELTRMKEVELVVRALDLESIEQMMKWSETKIAEFGEPKYWDRLMRAFSLGRFLRRLEDGTLFSSMPDVTAQKAASE